MGFDSGVIQCEVPDAAIASAVNSACSVYLGWRDTCSGCSLPPEKWGRTNQTSCVDGGGGGNQCASDAVGGKNVQFFAVNTDGDVNEDDKFYAGFHCPEEMPWSTTTSGTCGAGQLVTGVNGTSVECTDLRSAVVEYTRRNCSLYFGWNDSCSGCSSVPERWGSASATSCSAGPGASCISSNLGGQSLELVGVDLRGDVNDDDQFYVGLHCAPDPDEADTSTGSCAPGHFANGIDAQGSVRCINASSLIFTYMQRSCAVYAGWRDSCSGCGAGPEKWGLVTPSHCESGTGSNGTCHTHELGGTSVNLYGLNTDGDVDDNDSFYAGLLCD